MRLRLILALVVGTSLLAACSGGDSDPIVGADPARAGEPAAPDDGAPTTTTLPDGPEPAGPPPERGVFTVGEGGVELLLGPGGAGLGRIRGGVLLPYTEITDGFAHVTTPCENRAWVPLDRGVAAGPFRVVIDPGHGGAEPGAVGPGGLTEAELNFDVSQRVVDLLDAAGVPSVLSRSGEYRATLAFRVQMAVDAGAEVFVSVHHNAEPDEHRDTPGAESFYQYRSADSKRLTGLVQEEVYAAFSAYGIRFGADYDAGAKWRLSSSGHDYYGVIRRTFEAGIAGTLSEAAFISNPEEEALLRRDDVRQAEAEAIARGIQRYFAGEAPGDVFTEPYPRQAPAGGGGGAAGCEDPD